MAEALPRVFRLRIEPDGSVSTSEPHRYADGYYHLHENEHGRVSNRSEYVLPVATIEALIDRMLTGRYYIRMGRMGSVPEQNRLASISIPEMGHLQSQRFYKRGAGKGVNDPPPAEILERLRAALPEEDNTPYLPGDDDRRSVALAAIRLRCGQGRFRTKLIRRYGLRCMVSGCDVPEAIEAAHLRPYRGDQDNHVENGLLLRADIHALFDSYLWAVRPGPNPVVELHPTLLATEYGGFHERPLIIGESRPSQTALDRRWHVYNENLHSADR